MHLHHAAALLALAPAAAAQDIRVLTFDSTRTSTCGTLSFNVGTGSGFASIRSWLLDPARFGPGGVVPRSVNLVTQVPLLDPAALSGADVLLLSSTSPPLLRCEIADIVEFVAQGGGVFYFANSGSLDFNAAVGATGGDPGSGAATIVDPASPIASGPFGSVTGSIGALQFHRVLSDVGPLGNSVIETTGTFLAEFSIGSGRLVTAGDEEWVLSQSGPGCAAAQLPNVAREQLFLNAFASVIPAPGFQYSLAPQTVGTAYCGPAALNSRNLPATTCAFGSSVVLDNDLTLATDWLPANSFGYYLTSQLQGFVVSPGGSQGNLCQSGAVGRFNLSGQIQNSGSGGFFTLAPDLANVPQPTGLVPVLPGETWNFQAWYRDSNPSTTSNFSNAVSVQFQ